MILFLQDVLSKDVFSWLYIVENILEIILAYELVIIKASLAKVKREGWIKPFFIAIALVILMIDILHTAKILELSYLDELHRVIIHGVLHLLGFKDKTKEESKNMRRLEDECLSELLTLLNKK